MPKYTKQHFETVAYVLRTKLKQYEVPFYADISDENDDINEIPPNVAARVAIKGIALDFHNVFRLDNPRYDADKFMDACGIDDWRDINQVDDWDLRPYRGEA